MSPSLGIPNLTRQDLIGRREGREQGARREGGCRRDTVIERFPGRKKKKTFIMILLYIIVTVLVKIIFTAGYRKQTNSHLTSLGFIFLTQQGI